VLRTGADYSNSKLRVNYTRIGGLWEMDSRSVDFADNEGIAGMDGGGGQLIVALQLGDSRVVLRRYAGQSFPGFHLVNVVWRA